MPRLDLCRGPALLAAGALLAVGLAACQRPAAVAPAGLDGLPSRLTQGVISGAPNPRALTLALDNPGTCALAWSLTASTSDGRAWLAATPTSGTVPAHGPVATIAVALDPAGAGLGPGSYTGSLLFTGECALNHEPAQRSPRLVSVNLVVTPDHGACEPGFVPIPTSCGIGACARSGQISCTSGVYSNTCTPGTAAPSDLTCNGVDDDCNGAIDDGYVAPVTHCGVGHCAATGRLTCGAGALIDTCTAPCAALGTAGNPAASCAEIVQAGDAVGDGLYWLQGPTGSAQAFCDMTLDGGGWTVLFSGQNGSPHVFDHFDTGLYTGAFTDPAGSKVLRRAGDGVGDHAAELAVSCGAAVVAFPLTKRAFEFFAHGVQQRDLPLTARLVSGVVPNLPNKLWTGTSPGDAGFIFTTNIADGAATFASSYSGGGYDFCNGVANTTSPVRILVRESWPAPARNLPATAKESCGALLRAGEAAVDGIYWLKGTGAPYQAFCDMTTAGGGWTAFYAGRNGSQNVWDHLDSPTYQGKCPDPATRCLRRAPEEVGRSASELAVSCGGAMVAFSTTEAARRWMQSGTRAGYIPLTPTVLTGAVPNVPDLLWTGSAPSPSFIFNRAQGGGALTFASSYDGVSAADFDSCVGLSDNASLVRVLYREVPPAPVLNTGATARPTCAAILRAGESLGTGSYFLSTAAGATQLSYCDMATDGGGWTTLIASRNGTPNSFSNLDAPGFVDDCPDPASRCARRGPALLSDSAVEVAVSCGASMVAFGMTEPVRRWLQSGTQSQWNRVTARPLAGSPLALPDTFWAGVSTTDTGFILARNQAVGAGTFASVHPWATQYDFCGGVADTASMVRLSFREVTPAPERNSPQTPVASCRAVLDAGGGLSGNYWLDPVGGAPYLAYCEMGRGSGGWTTVLAGRNGSPNWFDAFDTAYYQGLCPDPASRCVRRPPPQALARASELAATCGSSMVSFPLTEQLRHWLSDGTSQHWLPVTPTLLEGTVPSLPNQLFTGAGPGQRSFILARNQGAGPDTFASNYSDATFDRCAGVADVASPISLLIREVASTPVKNTAATAQASCRAIRDLGLGAGDGLYWLQWPGQGPFLAYCDQTTDGGGWTTLYAGRNGSMNFFDAFDAPGYQGICTDPATRCVRRLRNGLGESGAELSVQCGAARVKFPMTSQLSAWLVLGNSYGWTPINASAVSGTVTILPNELFAGGGAGQQSFILASNKGGGAQTFASVYPNDAGFNFCNGAPDGSSLVRLLYREAGP